MFELFVMWLTADGDAQYYDTRYKTKKVCEQKMESIKRTIEMQNGQVVEISCTRQ